ncbi:MAG: single-stranded-DNA-specific exonuclease RecJ [Candidatus Thiodiazotropha sp. (ex Dulcina madagascariensis)]|nr:single-stranded-DNA-specific exonuclease RecJ [Candidatus Thiodiazotropha sp. (ex Dulcina madagascariensis)]MCU7928135.1 single-stranded-DNA-specific exonuclease RecJ [Candidatus Thiodiazotropha sp. (ex Dulcina madagascariensis)]
MNIQQRVLPSESCSLSATLHPVLQRVYHARGLTQDSDLKLELSQMLPVSRMKGVIQAAELLCETLCEEKLILIVGDYDADGATSTALAMLALKACGATAVSYLVPNRFEFGYGLTPEIVELAAAKSPGLIVTVDNGISSQSGVERAGDLGIPVLVTDHHLPAGELPPAAVIVNPNQPGDSFPSKHLAGVGVIFYVMAALINLLRARGWFDQRGLKAPNPADWLDLVALGTVSDLVPLDRNNRVLVSQGLRRIRAGRCRPGILALLEVAKRAHAGVVASDIGFALGPRLNAAGRLEDMGLGIECLLTESGQAARRMAQELDRLNQTRRSIEQTMKSQAEQALEQLHLQAEGALPAGLCLYDEGWHQGVVGILASRIKERYHRPVIVFAEGGEGILKGSARSIDGLHMRDLLERIDASSPGMILRFGGHAMAAGMSLSAEAFPRFKHAFEQQAAEWLEPAMLEGVILTDGELMPSDLNLTLAQALRDGGPWGQGFPEPLFEGCFHLRQQRVVGESHLKLRLAADEGGWTIDAIAFNQPPVPDRTRRVRLAYRLDVNDYRGLKSPQLIVECIQSTP